MNQMPKSVKAIKIRCYSSDSEANSLSFVSSRNIEFGASENLQIWNIAIFFCLKAGLEDTLHLDCVPLDFCIFKS